MKLRHVFRLFLIVLSQWPRYLSSNAGSATFPEAENEAKQPDYNFYQEGFLELERRNGHGCRGWAFRVAFKLTSDARFWLSESNGDVQKWSSQSRSVRLITSCWSHRNLAERRVQRQQVITISRGDNCNHVLRGQPHYQLQLALSSPTSIPKEINTSLDDDILKKNC